MSGRTMDGFPAEKAEAMLASCFTYMLALAEHGIFVRSQEGQAGPDTVISVINKTGWCANYHVSQLKLRDSEHRQHAANSAARAYFKER